MRIDPDGNDDYFELKTGKYLGSDGAESNNVRIMSQSDWDTHSSVNENGVRTVDHDIGNSNSGSFSEASTSMTNQSQLAVYQYYNKTGLNLRYTNNAEYNMAFKTDPIFDEKTRKTEIKLSIVVNLKENAKRKFCDNANEIINLFVNEKTHYDDYKRLGYDEYYKKDYNTYLEPRAIEAQMKHPSWNGTSERYKKLLKATGRGIGMTIP